MSETTTTPVTQSVDTLWSPQTVVALCFTAIVASALFGVFWRGDVPTIQLVIGLVMGYGSAITGFYFGSSKGSQNKDAALAASVTPTTTTTITPTVATTTTTPTDTTTGR